MTCNECILQEDISSIIRADWDIYPAMSLFNECSSFFGTGQMHPETVSSGCVPLAASARTYGTARIDRGLQVGCIARESFVQLRRSRVQLVISGMPSSRTYGGLVRHRQANQPMQELSHVGNISDPFTAQILFYLPEEDWEAQMTPEQVRRFAQDWFSYVQVIDSDSVLLRLQYHCK